MLTMGMGPWPIAGIMGLFITIFAPKTDRVFFHLLRGKAADIQNGQLCGLICSSPVICFSKIPGKYLVALKLMTSQVMQRA